MIIFISILLSPYQRSLVITTPTTKPPAYRPSVYGRCVSSATASLPLREAWCLFLSTRSLSIYFLSLFLLFRSLFLFSFWVLHGCVCCILSTGRRSLAHIFVISMCSLFSLHTLLYLWRGRVVRNDSLIRRLGRQRSGIGVKTVPRPHLPCNRLVLIRNSHVMVLGTSRSSF